ncbi:MAG TPA: phenylalanine--tRNA ligase subunit alpha [Candidatus Baltobacteraceae bacterium]
MSELGNKLDDLAQRFSTSVGDAADERALDAARVAFLGRSGEITLLRRSIGQLPADERPTAGKTINDVVERLEATLDAAKVRLQMRSFDAALSERIDVTFPAIQPCLGTIHPVRRIIESVCDFFQRRGFAVVLGPEIEPDYYNFDALNIPSDHPAREGFDSFFITDSLLLRPHTSPMQIRTMQTHRPPIAMVAPGKCYRRDALDARHLFQFHQVEGLLVAPGIHFGHLKWTLAQMCRELFGSEQQVRFRPSFFPFTEPSAEVDTTCPKCKGHGSCSMCGGSGWIELGGAGMVHPNVLREVGYDPQVLSGWAFGFGVERLGLTRYEIDDIRRFVDSDADFLHQLR